MEVVYSWAKGSKFYQIMEMTQVFEGSMISAIWRLEEALQQLILVLLRHATDTLAGIWFWLASTRCSLLPNRPWLTSSRRQGGRHLSDVAPAMYVSTHRPPRRACRPLSACASCSSTARKLGFECVLHPRDGDAGSGDRRRYVLGERRHPA